jgi:hypothetical protein
VSFSRRHRSIQQCRRRVCGGGRGVGRVCGAIGCLGRGRARGRGHVGRRRRRHQARYWSTPRALPPCLPACPACLHVDTPVYEIGPLTAASLTVPHIHTHICGSGQRVRDQRAVPAPQLADEERQDRRGRGHGRARHHVLLPQLQVSPGQWYAADLICHSTSKLLRWPYDCSHLTTGCVSALRLLLVVPVWWWRWCATGACVAWCTGVMGIPGTGGLGQAMGKVGGAHLI